MGCNFYYKSGKYAAKFEEGRSEPGSQNPRPWFFVIPSGWGLEAMWGSWTLVQNLLVAGS